MRLSIKLKGNTTVFCFFFVFLNKDKSFITIYFFLHHVVLILKRIPVNFPCGENEKE